MQNKMDASLENELFLLILLREDPCKSCTFILTKNLAAKDLEILF